MQNNKIVEAGLIANSWNHPLTYGTAINTGNIYLPPAGLKVIADIRNDIVASDITSLVTLAHIHTSVMS